MRRGTRLTGFCAWFGDGECLGLPPGRAYLRVDGGVSGQNAGVGGIIVDNRIDDRRGREG
jgi:hypothetical protein